MRTFAQMNVNMYDNGDEWNAMDFGNLHVTRWLLIISAYLIVFIVIIIAIYCVYLGYKHCVSRVFKFSSNATSGFEEIALRDVSKPSGTGSDNIGSERGVTSDTDDVGSAPPCPTHQGSGGV